MRSTDDVDSNAINYDDWEGVSEYREDEHKPLNADRRVRVRLQRFLL